MKLKWEQVGDIFFSSAPTGKKKKGVVVLLHRNLFRVVSLMVKIQLEGKYVRGKAEDYHLQKYIPKTE